VRGTWISFGWLAVGRELAKLEGVRKGKVRLRGERITVYEIGPAPEGEALSILLLPRRTDARGREFVFRSTLMHSGASSR
jgi:hypothetical protein